MKDHICKKPKPEQTKPNQPTNQQKTPKKPNTKTQNQNNTQTKTPETEKQRNKERNKKHTQKPPKQNYNTDLVYISPLKLLGDQDLS